MNEPVLVTGGAGFIGSALVHGLNARGAERIRVADFPGDPLKERNLAPLRIDGFIDAHELPALLERGALDDVRTVLHMGACSSTTETDARYLMRNNFAYTVSLAEWALRRGVRFVYASSAATYGALEGDLSDSADLGELRPLNLYGYSKQLFDQLAAARGLFDSITGLKYFNIFGPNEAHKGDMRSMASKAFEQVMANGRVRLFRSHRSEFRDGEQLRDFLYIKDAVAMTLHVAERPQATGLINVGSGEAHTWLELVRPVFAALGRPVDIEFIDMPEALRGKYQYKTRAVLDRLRASGYDAPVTPLPDAVREYVASYLEPDRRLGER